MRKALHVQLFSSGPVMMMLKAGKYQNLKVFEFSVQKWKCQSCWNVGNIWEWNSTNKCNIYSQSSSNKMQTGRPNSANFPDLILTDSTH